METAMTINDKAIAAQCNYSLRQETIMYYMPLAKRIAKDRASELFSEDDLEQIAIIAIIDTVDGYGYGKSAHISTLVRIAAKRAVDFYIKQEMNKYYNNICDLNNALKNESKYNNIYAELGVLGDSIRKVLGSLNKREAITVVCIDLLGFTLKETSPFVGYVCNDRVCQIHNKALRKLCHPSRSRKIKEFWQYAE